MFIRVCLSKRTQNLPPPAPCHTPYAACIRPPEPRVAAAQAEHGAGSCEGRGCRRRVALGWRKAETRIVLLGEPLTGSCSPEGFEATGGCAAWRWAAPQSAQAAPGHPQASQRPGPHVGRRPHSHPRPHIGRRPHVRHRPHIVRRPHSHPRPRITPTPDLRRTPRPRTQPRAPQTTPPPAPPPQPPWALRPPAAHAAPVRMRPAAPKPRPPRMRPALRPRLPRTRGSDRTTPRRGGCGLTRVRLPHASSGAAALLPPPHP